MSFLGRRLGITLLTLFLISLLTFAAFSLIPGDAALLSLGIEASDEQVAALRSERDLDKSLPAQYVSWLGRFLTGRLGNSARFHGQAIADLILERLPVTFSLAFMSLGLSILISFPVSVLTAAWERSPLGRLVTTTSTIAISLPGFFLNKFKFQHFCLSSCCRNSSASQKPAP
jgi:ABC-type dipeptide/oligopeptide/nickel transport system permease component